MLKEEVLEILPKLFGKIGFEKISIVEAKDSVYGEWDEKKQELIEGTLRDEYDLVIEATDFSHRELMDLSEILEAYPHIEMGVRDGNLAIFSRDINPKDKKKKET